MKTLTLSRPKLLILLNLFILPVLCLGNTKTDDPQKTYGNAVIDRINSTEAGYVIRCNVKDWPPVIGRNIPVRIDGIVPPSIVTEDGTPNRFFDQQTKKFIESTVKNAEAINLRNIKRAASFGIIAEVIVNGKSLANLLIESGLAKPGSPEEQLTVDKQPVEGSGPTKTQDTRVKRQKQTGSQQTQTSYVGSKNSKVFHRSECHFVKRILPENTVKFDSREKAIKRGKRPCKTCNP